jgi:hypothetical protein
MVTKSYHHGSRNSVTTNLSRRYLMDYNITADDVQMGIACLSLTVGLIMVVWWTARYVIGSID